MWVWEVVDEVEPIACYYQTLGSYFYIMLILLCYAMLVDVVWESGSMTDVRLLING